MNVYQFDYDVDYGTGKLITNDHGTWVGYYCPKCTGCGSYNKKI